MSKRTVVRWAHKRELADVGATGLWQPRTFGYQGVEATERIEITYDAPESEPEGKCPCGDDNGCCTRIEQGHCACHRGDVPCTNEWHARQVKVCKCAQVACCRAVEANFADGHPCCVCELPHANISGVRLSCLSCGKQPDPPPAPQRKVARVVEGFVSGVDDTRKSWGFWTETNAIGVVPATLTIYEPEPVKVPTLVEAVDAFVNSSGQTATAMSGLYESMVAALAREKGKR